MTVGFKWAFMKGLLTLFIFILFRTFSFKQQSFVNLFAMYGDDDDGEDNNNDDE